MSASSRTWTLDTHLSTEEDPTWYLVLISTGNLESNWRERAVADSQVDCFYLRRWIKTSYFKWTWSPCSFSFPFLQHWLGKIKSSSVFPKPLLRKVIFQLNLLSKFPAHPQLFKSDLPPPAKSSSISSKANLLIVGGREGKYRICCRHQARSPGS